MYCFKDSEGKLNFNTISDYPSNCWQKALGFIETDDQWAYQKQKLKEKGAKVVEIEIKEIA